MSQMIYEIRHGQWVFDNRSFSDHISIMYLQDGSGDMLLKHGSMERIRSLYESGKYQRVEEELGCRVRLIEDIPVKLVDMVNKCITISASPWISRLAEAVHMEKNTIDVECEVKDAGEE